MLFIGMNGIGLTALSVNHRYWFNPQENMFGSNYHIFTIVWPQKFLLLNSMFLKKLVYFLEIIVIILLGLATYTLSYMFLKPRDIVGIILISNYYFFFNNKLFANFSKLNRLKMYTVTVTKVLHSCIVGSERRVKWGRIKGREMEEFLYI